MLLSEAPQRLSAAGLSTVVGLKHWELCSRYEPHAMGDRALQPEPESLNLSVKNNEEGADCSEKV